ncbi:MAG: adenosylmethionine--8-amino-7-oxononanoate transaminase [Gammaproteobacteria bacterium]|nr:adenosylmethionine--8-amino-7-oxononanoate transaminase [Gammaproteobacteria bacterium]
MNQELIKRDLKYVWHPCSQMKDYQTTIPLLPIKQAKGVWLYDYNNNKYLDAISSWWVNLFGHSNDYINNKIKQQLDKLEHVILAGFSHEPIIELSEKLVNLAPPGLTKCFYADNGSSAIEVALKMSFHYWKNLGYIKKNKFVSLSNSYHGETLGALSVGNVELYKQTYKPLLLDIITAPTPDCFFREAGESWQDYSMRKFLELEHILEQEQDNISAIFIEPLVQCAGNMRMYHPVYLTKLRQACDKFNIHLIADEIAVGFGRTGTMFACEQAHITPDIICLSKGLTGGYLPLSVTMTTDTIYNAFYDDYNKQTAFLHSHSFTGNPLACVAALATLELFEQQNTIEHNKHLSKIILNNLSKLLDHPNIIELRQTGMITAFELAKDKSSKTLYPWQERRGLTVYKHGLKNSILLRPLGNTIYFMPPYTITEEEINLMTQVAIDGVNLAVK